MTQIGKLNDMFYEVNKNTIRLEVVEKSDHHPNVHITQNVYSNSSDFFGSSSWKSLSKQRKISLKS